MKTLTRIGIVVLLCALALGYLHVHDRSLRLTQRIAALDSQRRFLFEERDSLQAVALRLSGFVRLDSLWMAAGRQQYLEPERVRAQAGPDSGPLVVAHVNGVDDMSDRGRP